jgi:hypothetical protein
MDDSKIDLAVCDPGKRPGLPGAGALAFLGICRISASWKMKFSSGTRIGVPALAWLLRLSLKSVVPQVGRVVPSPFYADFC